ncbi:ankyrin repeat domain-containing protein [Opitutus terrae]|uniref:ankyrin repeat domain-containing protein n=1 Tax=Opitutus terrae TaxID=107709 RepID=UPI0013052745|nr:ankyrin repeat domain-containing protein [Opitutus terrae]
MRTVTALLFSCCLAVCPAAALGAPEILLIAGAPSHGPGEHRFPAGCTLLADALNESPHLVHATAVDAWPAPARLAAADVLVIFSDGLERHVAREHLAELRQHVAAGKGLAVLHFALEPSPGPLADFLLENVGGRFEPDWSVNPVWKLEHPIVGSHEVTRGVMPFSLEDEWYFHLRFRPEIVPVLQAHPPVDVLGEDGPRSGNPTVRAALTAGEPQTLAWVFEQNGRRAFGFTGGHFHRNWADEAFRRLVLNGIVWTAHAAVPPGGVTSSAPALPRFATIDEAIARDDLADVQRHLALNPTLARHGANAALAPLHQAILRNRTAIALLLLEAGADANAPDRSRRTPLHLAVERDNLPILEALLARGARPSERDRIGWTPLHHAAAKDRLDLARALLKSGADPMTLSDGGGTPLHEAAASGSAEMVRLLLDAGVDASVVSKSGVTALEIAREYHNEPAIAALTKAASPNPASTRPDVRL